MGSGEVWGVGTAGRTWQCGVKEATWWETEVWYLSWVEKELLQEGE